uniref:Histone deacetylase 14 n=1 Tax=Tanacetum cinerariifolium TaxID=118510 RepID=A0A6L2K0B9_TANCI|nr:histone deacetylase 14 [Tanacetum cinerariifolium]GEX50369.1 histone deacetylase 14 [Tanacetum cinerariifolium]
MLPLLLPHDLMIRYYNLVHRQRVRFTVFSWTNEDWFTLDTNLLREALEITPIDQAHQFESPPLGNAIMDFVNELGYPEELHFVSRMAMNNIYQPWRAILSMINQCLTYKTSGKYNINQRSGSSFNMAKDDHRLGNLKFIHKGEEDEVFGMTIPKELITDNIMSAPYYNAYLEMVAKHDHKISKPVKEKFTPVKKATKGKVRKVRKGNSSPQLVDEPDEEPQLALKPQVEDEEYDLQRGIQMSLEPFRAPGRAPVGGVAFREPASSITQKLPFVEGKRKGITSDEQRRIPVTEEASTRPFAQPEDDTSANIICNTSSPTDAETGAETDKMNSKRDTKILNIGEEQGEDVATKVDLEEKTTKINKGKAGSDPGKTPESRLPPKRVLTEEDQAGPNPVQIHVSLARPDPEPIHDEFVATMFPQVHESLKQPDEEHVHVDNPLRSTRTLSSIKNLDAYIFGDQFFNDKLTEEDLRKINMETKVESMVTISIHQASSLVPSLSTPIIDLTPPKLVSFTDLPHKIDQTVNEAIKEAVQVALQAPLRELFRDLSEADMKEILHDRMFEIGSYQSQPEHVALYEALEASMDRDNRDEFLEVTAKSHKRRRDDQDPPPPLPDLDQGKQKRHRGHICCPSSKDQAQTRLAEAYSKGRKSGNTKTRLGYPEEDKLLQRTSDMSPFIKWYCRRIGNSKLSKADLEGPAYKIDLVNPEGHQVIPDVSKPLPLGCPPGQEASDFLYKEDYTIVSKLRGVIYRDRNDQKKMKRETEVHKFSDGTLTKILERLDHMVKDFRLFKYNPGIETKIWSEDDRRRSKAFMEVIEARLRTRRIFKSLESFVNGRLRDVDYRLI